MKMVVQLTTLVFDVEKLKAGGLVALTFTAGHMRRGIITKVHLNLLEIAYYNEVLRDIGFMDLVPDEAHLIKEFEVF